MIYDQDAEVCKQCTLKHLTTALVTLNTEEMPDILKRVYFCGNLSHAGNHFVKLDETLAEKIRALRIDAQDDSLNFVINPAIIRSRLMAIIKEITEFGIPQAPAPAPVETPVAAANGSPVVQKRGCPCHARK